MARHEHLPIYKPSYELLGQVVQITKEFPREFKFTVGQRLRDEVIELLVLIYRANSQKDSTRKGSTCRYLVHAKARIASPAHAKSNFAVHRAGGYEIDRLSRLPSAYNSEEYRILLRVPCDATLEVTETEGRLPVFLASVSFGYMPQLRTVCPP